MTTENEFMAAYPTVVYRNVQGMQESYAPPIPAKAPGQLIMAYDSLRPGLYPDYVVHDLVRERNQFKIMAEDDKASADEGWNLEAEYRGLYEDQKRLANVLREKLSVYEVGAGYEAGSSSAGGA